MKYVQIIFSPTGGTEKVANTLTEKWPGVETIDLSATGENRSKIVFQPEDVALIAMPSFGGLAPQVALDRLGAIKGNGADRAQLAEFAEKIQVKLKSGDLKKPAIPGNRPYKKAGSTPLVPKPDKSCVKCGSCAKTCPVQAIEPVQFIADGKKCIACMRCVSICPQKARKVNGAMVSVAALAIKKACSVRKENELFV